MNPPPPPPPPFTNPSSFTFLQPIPNHNPSSNSLLPQIPPPPSSPDLPTTLSTLKNLLHLSHSTLHSLSSSLFSPNDPVLVSCPFNPHHRMPPPYLFRHSLQCPSRIDLDLDLESLRYPHSLTFSPQSHHHHHQNSSNAEELCFSLADYYGDFGGSNFFYRDCPGVVSSFSSHNQDSAAKWMFTLPGVLSVECANVVASNGDREMTDAFGIDCLGIKLLASDFWAIRSEVDMWSDYPNMYSYVVLSAAVMCSRLVHKESDLKRWVIVNSPRYGVVIDEAMRDHIFMLFRLSLKAIVREAFGSAEMVINREVNEQVSKSNLKSMRFKCPVLVQVLRWLVSQLSVLYGEANGKMFAINMFKQCLFSSASGSLLISMDTKEMESTASTEVTENLISNAREIKGAKLEYPVERSLEHELGESANSSDIFVYQLAAAVAALHERALLEEKIKALRRAQPFTNYQIVAEHAYVSKRAEEERQKRCNYRPILEHDGLLLQRSYNQETSKTKTREELLAEERDYKRRRMSYHGKKLKRTRTQVMRDIIDEYMEDIKRAGGIGCFMKGSEEGGMLSSEPYSVHDNNPDKKRSIPDSSDASTELLHGYKKQSYSVDNVKSFSKGYERKKQLSRGHNERPANNSRTISRDGRDRKYDSRSPDGSRSHVWLDEQSNCRSEQNDMKVITPKHDEDSWVSSNVSKFHDTRSWKLETKDTRRRNAYRSQTSDPVIKNTFDDRYDPSESHYGYSK